MWNDVQREINVAQINNKIQGSLWEHKVVKIIAFRTSTSTLIEMLMIMNLECINTPLLHPQLTGCQETEIWQLSKIIELVWIRVLTLRLPYLR